MGTFAEDVVVQAEGPGRYTCDLSHDWDLVAVPQGGVVASVALRAASVALRAAATEVNAPTGAAAPAGAGAAPPQKLRTCTTVFAGQVAAGRLVVDVQVLRQGRSASQVLATVANEGAPAGATVLAVFGGPRRGPTFVDVVPPEVPAPSECRSYRDPVPPGVEAFDPLPFWTRVEGRAALGHPPWEEFEPTGSDVATWLRFDDPPRAEDGSLDPLAVLTLADRMPGSIGERLGQRGPRWFAPSADLTVHLLEPLRTDWVLAHDRARWADDGWASAETTLWDERGVLVAYATQMMLFTYLEG